MTVLQRSLALVVCVGLFVATVAFSGSWMWFGFVEGSVPFVDAHFVLAAWECSREGVDVVATNPCDVNGRRFIYPPAWLRLASSGLGTEDTFWVGSLVSAAFLLAASLLLAPMGALAWTVSLSVMLSPAVMYLLERGNVDALIFAGAALVLRLASGGLTSGTVLALGVSMLLALLKVYPLALVVVLLALQSRIRLRAGGVLLGLGILYVVLDHEALRHFASAVPYEPSLSKFGSAILPFSLSLVMDTELPEVANSRLILLMIFVGACIPVHSWVSGLRHEGRLYRRELIYWFLGGAGILVFCFLATINVPYRMAFVVLTLPWLIEVARYGEVRAWRRIAMLMLLLSAFEVWHMRVMTGLVEYMVTLAGRQELIAYKLVVDAYILFSQLATWLHMVLLTVVAQVAGRTLLGSGYATMQR